MANGKMIIPFPCPDCGERRTPITQQNYIQAGLRRRRVCKSCGVEFATFTLDGESETFDCYLLDENRNSAEYNEKRRIYAMLELAVGDWPEFQVPLERARQRAGVYRY